MEKIVEIFKKFDSFALFCHISPDADTLCSANALKLVLKKLKKKAYIFCDGKVPKNMKFLGISLEQDEKIIGDVDVCVMVDCNSLDRIGKYSIYFENAKLRVNIDHHQLSDYTFDYSYFDTSSPSTADLMYEILKQLNTKLNSQIALNLYAGLSTDTGCFEHASTNANSHRHTYELLEYKFDLSKANYNLFKYKQRSYLYFYKTALRNTKAYDKGRIYVTYFNNRMFKKFENILENSNCFSFLDGIDGNEIRVKIIEKQKGCFSVGFRSNAYANVCDIANTFGGGGHIRASGCTIEGEYKDVLCKLIEACKQELHKH